MKIGVIIILGFVILAVTGSLFEAGYYYNSSNELLKADTTQHLETAAHSKAKHIETYLNQNIERLKLIISGTRMNESLKSYNKNPTEENRNEMIKIMTDAKEAIPEIERIGIIGTDGIVIASTDEKFYGKNVQEKEFFVKGLQENNVYFTENNGDRELFSTGPIVLEGEVIGVGIIAVNLETMESIVKDRTGLGITGEIFVAIEGVDAPVFLFERMFEQEALQHYKDNGTALPMQMALEGREMFFEETVDYRGRKVLVVALYLETGKIGIVAKMDESETLGLARNKLIESLAYTVLIIIILSVLIGFLVSRIISKSVAKLTKDVDNITKGALDTKLTKSRITEVQSLTDSLNRILASLKLAILRTGMTKGEMGLEEAVKEKEKAETKYKALFEGAADAIFVADAKTRRLVDCNNEALKITGYSKKEILSMKADDLHPKKVRKKTMEGFKKQTQDLLKIQESILLTKDGKKIPVSISTAIIQLEHTKQMIGIFRNITKK